MLVAVHRCCGFPPKRPCEGDHHRSWESPVDRPCRFHRARRLEIPPTNSRLIHGSASGPGGTNNGRNDGIAKRRKRSAAKGTSGSRSASEYRRAGGTIPRDPGEGRRRRLMNRWRETCQVRRDLIPCPRNDNGSRGLRVHEMRNRVRVMCKPGSVGGRGGQPPRSTRPGLRSTISVPSGPTLGPG